MRQPIVIVFLMFSVFFVLSISSVQAAAPVTIVANPGSFGTIEQTATAEAQTNWWDDNLADDTAVTESFAATELRHFLAAVTELREEDIALASARAMPPVGDVFLIGNGNSNPLINSIPEADAEDFVPKTAESYHIRSFIQNNRTITVIKGSDRVGTLYGVYAYLTQLGIRFYGLGEQGTVYPDTPVVLPREIDLVGSPHYLTRGFWTWEDRGDRTFFLWMARNRLNFWTDACKKDLFFLKKLGMQLTAGGHDIQHHCLSHEAEYPYNHPRFNGDDDKPTDPYEPGDEYAGDTNGDGKLSYFEAHPEWFGLQDGKRSNKTRHEGTHGDNYCTSNTDATHELAKNFVQQCIDGVWQTTDIVNFWMLDGARWCQCEACKRQGTPTDRLLEIVHTTMMALKEARQQGRLKRDVKLATLAYHDTLPPPSKPLPEGFDYDRCFVTFFPIRRCYVHPLGDPACTEINRSICDKLQGWTTGPGRYYTGSMFIGEYYNVSSLKSLPVVFPTIMAADIPWYYRMGVRHFHYMHTPARLWGTWTLNQYLMASLLWDIDTNVDTLLAEYFNRFYPTTATRARAFYRHLEYALSNIKALKHNVATNEGAYALRMQMTRHDKPIFPLDHLHYEVYSPVLNDGPDLVEIVDTMSMARRQIDDALIECGDATECARLMEDKRRFDYGDAVILLYYHMTRTIMFHRQKDEVQARREFAALQRQADYLKTIVDLVQVASSHANAANGLEAANVQHIYKYLEPIYGTDEPAAP